MRIDGGVKGAKVRKWKLLDKQGACSLVRGTKRSRHGRRRCGTFEHGQSGGLIERRTGNVSIPQEAFIAALRMGEE